VRQVRLSAVTQSLAIQCTASPRRSRSRFRVGPLGGLNALTRPTPSAAAGRPTIRDAVPVTEPRAEHWDDVYSSKGTDEVSWFQSEPERSLRHITAVADVERSVVDVGAGASVLVDRLLDVGFHDLTVVDISAQALATVRDRLGDRADVVTFTCSNVLAWQPGRTFDVWHDRAVFHFLTRPDDRASYVALATSAVDPGGHLVLSAFALDGPTHCSGLEVARHDASSLAEEFAAGFTLLHSDREEHRTPWQAIQPFTWVVLRRHSV